MTSSFLSDFLALSDIVGADFFAEGALAHKAFLDQKLDKGSLHNPTGRICRADYKGAPWIRRVVGCGGGLSRLTYGGSNLYCSLSDWGHPGSQSRKSRVRNSCTYSTRPVLWRSMIARGSRGLSSFATAAFRLDTSTQRVHEIDGL
jgi:hypothetical protein